MNSLNNRIWLVSLTSIGALVAGCNTTQGEIDSVSPTISTVNRSYPGATIVYGSKYLAMDIWISDARFQPVGQLTRAQVTLENTTETRYTLEYKFDWEDRSGFSVDNMGTWHRFTVAPREIRKFTSTGKTPEATGIIFTIRLPDDTFLKSPEPPPAMESDPNANNPQ